MAAALHNIFTLKVFLLRQQETHLLGQKYGPGIQNRSVQSPQIEAVGTPTTSPLD